MAVGRLAGLLNHTADAARFQARQAELEMAWEATFYNTSSQRYDDPYWKNTTAAGGPNGHLPVQTAQALGIALGLDAAHMQKAGSALAADVEHVYQVHPATGWWLPRSLPLAAPPSMCVFVRAL